MLVVRRTLVAMLALVGAAALAAGGTSCTTVDLSQCDYVVTRCQPVYSTWCDGYGCYPTYYQQCWQDCYVLPDPPVTAPPAPGADAGAPAPPDAAPADDAAPPAAGDGGDGGEVTTGPLCGPCTSNDECGPGGLCILRGGDSGPTGFCGRACTGSDCPAGYECSSLGSSRQCLPVSGVCP